MTHPKPRPFSLDELRAYLVEIFPEFWKRGDLRVEDIAPMTATLRLVYHPRHLRPGGTISGAAMFAVCDAALFVAILGEVGRVAHAVTTSASINFLRRTEPADLIGKARLIKARQEARGRPLFRGRERDGRPRDRDLFDSRSRRSRPAVIRPSP